MADSVNYEVLNLEINAFAAALQSKLLAKWASIDRSPETKKRQAKGQWSNYKKNASILSHKVIRSYGIPNAIRLYFAAYAVFIEKGVGKNYTIEEQKAGGAKWGGYGNGPRKPKEWYKPVLENEVPKLASLIAESYAQLSIKVTKI